MKQKLSGIILVIAMILSLIPCAYAEDKPITGSCGDNGSSVSWNYNNGTLIIFGNGVIEVHPEYLWYYQDDIKRVIIEDGVTSIGESAFMACSNLISIDIPSTVNSIGNYAFSSCEKLETVNYYGYVWDDINIGESGNADLIAAYKFSNAVDIVDQGTCGKDVSNLIWTLTKDGTITINGTGEMANFESGDDGPLPDQPWKLYMTKIKKVVIEQGVTATGYRAFHDAKNLTSVTLPEGFTNLAWLTFFGCNSLTDIKLPESLTRIGHGVFDGCSSITSITIPENVTFIDVFAFRGTSISTINIPKNVSYIGECAFEGCMNLSSITAASDSAYYTAEDGILFSKDKTTLMCHPQAKKGTSYTVPDNVKIIYGGAFQGCSFEKITLPKGIQEIANWTFKACKNLKDMVIPDGVTMIGYGAFHECTGMESITIPASVVTINSLVFGSYSNNMAYNLKDVYYGGTEEQWKKIHIDRYNNVIAGDSPTATIHCSDSPAPAPSSKFYTVTGDTTTFHAPVTMQKGNIKIQILDKDGKVLAESEELRFESVPEDGRINVTIPRGIKVGDIIRIFTRNRDVY